MKIVIKFVKKKDRIRALQTLRARSVHARRQR
jgi:hypothetical protein